MTIFQCRNQNEKLTKKGEKEKQKSDFHSVAIGFLLLDQSKWFAAGQLKLLRDFNRVRLLKLWPNNWRNSKKASNFFTHNFFPISICFISIFSTSLKPFRTLSASVVVGLFMFYIKLQCAKTSGDCAIDGDRLCLNLMQILFYYGELN